MEQFKLKSIDEFDAEFAHSIGVEAPPQKKEEPAPSLIPEIFKTNSAENQFTLNAEPAADIQNPSVHPANNQTIKTDIFTPAEGETKAPGLFDALDEDAADDKEKKKSSPGILIGKIAAIVMLCATVVFFIFGCFISIFLDNNGSAIGGTTFNTMAADNDKLSISKGDMIIGKKLDASEYQVNTYVAVPSSTGKGCDIMAIVNVENFGNYSQLTVRDTTGNASYYSDPTYNSDEVYGEVENYIPSVAGLLGFAMENAILVCILFILIAALCCLVLILIEKTASKKFKSETEDKAEISEEISKESAENGEIEEITLE